MAQIIGQIESLKKIRHELNRNGITKINSIGDIKNFLNNCESKIQTIIRQNEIDLNHEIKNLKKELISLQKELETSKNYLSDNLDSEILLLNEKIEGLKLANSNFMFAKFINWIKVKKIGFRRNTLVKKLDKIVENRTNYFKKKINKTIKLIDELTNNRDVVVSKRSKPQITEILNTKKVLEKLNPLIAGAIGENLVVKELKNLPDDYFLFNDFSMNFNPPIYNRKENDRIFSIQIDHLLISKAGIFIIETKNWSRNSIERFDFRSPIEQIKRTNYALFVTLNSEFEYNRLNLNAHHWGPKQIPIRNVIAMINEKPKERFKYVAVKSLYELTDYFNFFDPIFTKSEVNKISRYLRSIKE
ncbi:NERD domain-containing protein [Tamlana flava]|uniref:NERD domain-containing protein n=1 Tax=Tamlana flava TaxID=3158572 RepID=UPI00351AD227